MIQSILRTTWFSFGLFILLNLFAGLRSSFNANHWLLDLSMLPSTMQAAALLLLAGLMMYISVRLPHEKQTRRTAGILFGAFAAIALINSVTYYHLLASNTLHDAWPVPFSAAICLLLMTTAIYIQRASQKPFRKRTAVLMLPVLAAMFPLCQMGFFGKTDYRRPATAAVVLGARAYADGRASDALADRVHTGVDLYLQGHVEKLIFSGGPGDGDITEPQAMKALAMSRGVPADAIILDEQGVSTQATVNNTLAAADRLLVVSHAFHLPRIKMTYEQAGAAVYTVPAKERYVLTQMPYLMAREVAAWWAYYLRGLA